MSLHDTPITSNNGGTKNSPQGLKKVPSASLGQVDYLAGQVTFKTYLPIVQGSRIVIL